MLKDIKQSKVIAVLKIKFSFRVESNREHIKLKNDSGARIVLPNHKLIKGSTLSRELRNVGIDKNIFFNYITQGVK